MNNIIAENPQSTVVADYTPRPRDAASYQSEAALEEAFIAQLEEQAYERIRIDSEAELIVNLRCQLEILNNYQFTDGEWARFFMECLASKNEGIVEKTRKIQEDYIQLLRRDNGENKNIYLLDKRHIHNNRLQIMNQYEANGKRANRYDVTILVNGLPLVHVELKRRGVSIREAFNQINRYQRDSFWAGSGLFEYVQLFVISNGTHSKYYSNTTRWKHIKEAADGTRNGGKKTSNSFEFTSWWADANNVAITDLVDFAATFFSKHTLLAILTRYCVFTADQDLLVMRPYQIVATERILNRIDIAGNMKQLGTVKAGGYVWHTTGSGKTLTSFKAAQLASKLPDVAKVLFVVDRKDLDYQTMKEYDKFQKGAANSNTSTRILQRQLENTNAKIIITTIQKLDQFIKKNRGHLIFGQRIVLIFDECHRSQFGDMHKAITRAFKKYHLFGFTGTPIFPKNSGGAKHIDLQTTAQAFGDQLHTYTIVNAIADKNVLPFRIDYVRTIREADDIADMQVPDIAREKALSAPERIANVVQYIRQHFDQKTRRNARSYEIKQLANVQETAAAERLSEDHEVKNKIHVNGFNSIFAVSSIEAAKRYYAEFKRQQKTIPSAARLKVATIFSYAANEAEQDGMEDENSDDTSGLDASSRDFLEGAITDYNAIFGTNYDTSADKFANYYKDVSLRVKNRDIDLLIVVNMFLTGFDATTLNTLWVDKNLRMHGLLQAYSRTNRILNSIKTYGNIVTFRNLERATNESLALFGDKNAGGVVLLKTFNEYYNGYCDGDKEIRGYTDIVANLKSTFPLGEPIISEQQQKQFIALYNSFLKLRNILISFDDFQGREILSERDLQDYQGMYLALYEEFRKIRGGDTAEINDDVVFEMELVKQVEINIEYIMQLIHNYHDSNCSDKEILSDINRAIDSSVELRSKKDLIEQFVASLTVDSNVDEDWQKHIQRKRREELDGIIAAENLDAKKTYQLINLAFRDGAIPETGTNLTAILPPMSLFSKNNALGKKRETVLDKLKIFFNRFFDIAEGKM